MPVIRIRRILPAAAAAVLAATALGGCSPQQVADLLHRAETRDATGEITEGGATDVFTLREGDCLDDASMLAHAQGDESATGPVTEVRTLPCTEPHDFEVYRNVTLSGGDDYPGADPVYEEADALCGDAFEEYVEAAYDDSIYDYVEYTPTADGWATGDRVANCLIGDPAGKTVGSLAGIGR
jgi:hypothetical protein